MRVLVDRGLERSSIGTSSNLSAAGVTWKKQDAYIDFFFKEDLVRLKQMCR